MDNKTKINGWIFKNENAYVKYLQNKNLTRNFRFVALQIKQRI